MEEDVPAGPEDPERPASTLDSVINLPVVTLLKFSDRCPRTCTITRSRERVAARPDAGVQRRRTVKGWTREWLDEKASTENGAPAHAGLGATARSRCWQRRSEAEVDDYLAGRASTVDAASYHWRHETCWYAVKKGAQAHWTGDRKASTLWEIDNPRKSETGHSAQKPVECMQRAIHNHKGDVYDPFVGSGTTVIAGEQEGRIVYAICNVSDILLYYVRDERSAHTWNQIHLKHSPEHIASKYRADDKGRLHTLSDMTSPTYLQGFRP